MDAFYEWWSYAFDVLDLIIVHLKRVRHMTPEHATTIVILVTLGIGSLVLDAWLRAHDRERRRVAWTALSLPLFLAIMLNVPNGYQGTPDDRCAEYEDGKLNYVLVSMVSAPRRFDEVYGEKWLLIIVRAHTRWGDNPHYCRLEMSDPKVRSLATALEGYMTRVRGSNGRGVIHFSFGGREEKPNVRFRPLLRGFDKDVPPEVDPRNERES